MEEFDQLAAPGYPVFLGSEFVQPAEVDALFQVIPIPYEASVSYGGGTADGPKTILEASWQLEQWDGKSIPGQEGIFTHAPIDCSGEPQRRDRGDSAGDASRHGARTDSGGNRW